MTNGSGDEFLALGGRLWSLVQYDIMADGGRVVYGHGFLRWESERARVDRDSPLEEEIITGHAQICCSNNSCPPVIHPSVE